MKVTVFPVLVMKVTAIIRFSVIVFMKVTALRPGKYHTNDQQRLEL